MIAIEHGPTLPRLGDGVDAYKPTMGQLQFEKHKDAQVTFTFHNRASQQLTEYVDVAELQQRLNVYQKGWDKDELVFLARQERIEGGALFSDEYLQFLQNEALPPVEVTIDPDTQDIAIETTGTWPLVTFWETVVMSEVNELYFETKIRKEGLDLEAIYDEGDRRLSEKIALLQSRPDIQFADFGTRRRFSRRWHEYVVGRLKNECPQNLIGVSSVGLADQFNLTPIGTCAHEMDMVYAALADGEGEDPMLGHGRLMNDWVELYGENLSTALPDTFGSDFFFADMTPEQAKHWKAIRHDSGDPIEFGEKVIAFYEEMGINPLEKTIVFSDGLDIETIVMLADYFKGKINLIFGWGTTLTNDLGLKPLNIVMKATMANGTPTVKLSDNKGKNTGPEDKVALYTRAAAKRVAQSALRCLRNDTIVRI